MRNNPSTFRARPENTINTQEFDTFGAEELTCCLSISQTIIIGAYVIIFGLGKFQNSLPDALSSFITGDRYEMLIRSFFPPSSATALLEFQIPPQVSRYASFLFSFIGRGIFYIFVGSILLHEGVWRIIAGTIVGLIGVCYVVLEFIPSIEPPANMREADAGWGAEQV